MHKDDLRRQIRQIKRQFTPQQLEELSLPIISRLKPMLVDTQVVMAYYSLPDEVCTHSLINDLVTQGKTVLLPKVMGDDTMELRRYTSRDDMQEGAFHILEPVGEQFTDEVLIDVVLVPGVAFDAKGHRLGRGRGYYDRFLRAYKVRTIGVCFDFQKVNEVPVDAFDVKVDEVI